MSTLKKLISGGLPAVLDQPETARTAGDTDMRFAPTPQQAQYSERGEPAAPGSTTAMGQFGSKMNNQTVMMIGGALLAGVALALIIRN